MNDAHRNDWTADDLIGIAEIADLAGVSAAAVANWRARGRGFPAPVRELRAGPLFSANAVRRWLQEQRSMPISALAMSQSHRSDMGAREDETCRRYVVPRLRDAGWYANPGSVVEQKTVTDGRIVVAGRNSKRRRQKRCDYLLNYTRDLPLAVVEAKRTRKRPGDGLQQAKDYGVLFDVSFVYSTNGTSIIEFDFITGRETELDEFPSPAALLERLRVGRGLTDDQLAALTTPARHFSGYAPRYYQEVAINRALTAIAGGDRRALLTMATGTGKTVVAFQIAWRLWSMGWNADGAPRKPRILFLADRNVLVDDPMAKTFAEFGDARYKIEGGEISKGREMYFAIYQALAEDERRPGLYREFDPTFFDAIIIDECHRGSARDTSTWREILAYFEPAFQIGMTATPLREETRDTYRYFGNPIYTYSLRQGMRDGFLAPYSFRRIQLDVDREGWVPTPGERDRFGREIPEGTYTAEEFERVVKLRARTEAIAQRITDWLRSTDRHAKTIVFCVDQEHAADMRRALTNLNADLVRDNPNYVARITSEEGDIGRGLLSQFQDVESDEPILVTTSQLLTTGVDVPTCQNIVIARPVRSISEFKQILGRGTRVRDDYGKLAFTLLDFTDSATRLFHDPEFDGQPALITEEELNAIGEPTEISETAPELDEPDEEDELTTTPTTESGQTKYYVDHGRVRIEGEQVFYLGPDGEAYDSSTYPDYVGERIRARFATAAEVRALWVDPRRRAELLEELGDIGVDVDQLATATGEESADSLDLLNATSFGTPVRSRRERAEAARQRMRADAEGVPEAGLQVLEALIEKYIEHGFTQFVLPDVLKVPPISEYGNVAEIVSRFGSAESLRLAVERLQRQIYEA